MDAGATQHSVLMRRILKQFWGYPHFRLGQAAVIEACLARRDVFVVMATGSGKSLCYQVPVLVHRALHNDTGYVGWVHITPLCRCCGVLMPRCAASPSWFRRWCP